MIELKICSVIVTALLALLVRSICLQQRISMWECLIDALEDTYGWVIRWKIRFRRFRERRR